MNARIDLSLIERIAAELAPYTDYLPIVADMLAGQFNTPWRAE